MRFWDGQRWIDEPTPAPSRSPRTTSRFFHVGQALLEGALIAALAVGLIAGSAFAAKGGNHGSTSGKGGSSFTGPDMVADLDGNGVVSYGDEINFTVSTSASYPEVGLRCYQGTTWVYDAYVSYFDSWLSAKYFTLDSSYWQADEAANCTARLFYYNKHGTERVLATLSFDAAP